MANESRRWYQLDGEWHKSIATKHGALHLPSPDAHTDGCALCEPMTRVLYMGDDGYSEKEAVESGRQCKRCLKLSEARPTERERKNG